MNENATYPTRRRSLITAAIVLGAAGPFTGSPSHLSVGRVSGDPAVRDFAISTGASSDGLSVHVGSDAVTAR